MVLRNKASTIAITPPREKVRRALTRIKTSRRQSVNLLIVKTLPFHKARKIGIAQKLKAQET